MADAGQPSVNDLVELLVGRPGWRLEPSSTPGVPPLWCFVDSGKIEFSVSGDEGRGQIRLYVMETDQEIVFDSVEGLTTWLRANRPEAALEPEPPGQKVGKKKSRFRRFTEWS